MPDEKVDMVAGVAATGPSVAALVALAGRRRRAFRPDPDWEPAAVPSDGEVADFAPAVPSAGSACAAGSGGRP